MGEEYRQRNKRERKSNQTCMSMLDEIQVKVNASSCVYANQKTLLGDYVHRDQLIIIRLLVMSEWFVDNRVHSEWPRDDHCQHGAIVENSCHRPVVDTEKRIVRKTIILSRKVGGRWWRRCALISVPRLTTNMEGIFGGGGGVERVASDDTTYIDADSERRH